MLDFFEGQALNESRRHQDSGVIGIYDEKTAYVELLDDSGLTHDLLAFPAEHGVLPLIQALIV